MPPPWMYSTALPGWSPADRRYQVASSAVLSPAGQGELFGGDALGWCGGGGDVVHHPVTADATSLDVADRGCLCLPQRFDQLVSFVYT